MQRSPIEMMVDKACGFDANSIKQKEPRIHNQQDDEAITKALVRVGNAAAAWHLAKAEGRMTSAIARKLDGAAAKLVQLGWH